MHDRLDIRNRAEHGGTIRGIAREIGASRNAIRRALAPGARMHYSRPTSITDEVRAAVSDVLAQYPLMSVKDVAVLIDWRRSRRRLSDLVSELRAATRHDPAPGISTLDIRSLNVRRLSPGTATTGTITPGEVTTWTYI